MIARYSAPLIAGRLVLTASAVAGPVLSPLSRAEMRDGIEAGLGCDFRVGAKTYLLVATNGALIKVDGIVRSTALGDEKGLAIINYGGSFEIGTLKVYVAKQAKVIAQGVESASYRGRLTVTRGARSTSLVGVWTCGT